MKSTETGDGILYEVSFRGWVLEKKRCILYSICRTSKLCFVQNAMLGPSINNMLIL